MRAEMDAWIGLHERMARVKQAMETGTGRTLEQEADTLRKRAERLARPAAGPDRKPGRDYLRFRLGVNRFLLDASAVAAVVSPENLIPVPKSPGAVLGVFGFRDGVATLLSLPALTGLPEAPPAEGDWLHAILLLDGVADEASAVQASEILGMAVLADEEEIAPLTTTSLRGLAGRTREGEYVLDAARLLEGLAECGIHLEPQKDTA